MSYDRFDREEKDSHFYEYVDGKKKPCRACTSFKSVLHSYAKENKKSLPNSENAETEQNHKECPLDKDELGRRTWSFLHTMTAYYPDRPSSQQQQDMKEFIHLFSKFYPCDWCAKDFRKSIKQNEPDTNSQSKLSLWMCQQHNVVNRKLGKQEFDCSRYNERWRDGWKDGSCD